MRVITDSFTLWLDLNRFFYPYSRYLKGRVAEVKSRIVGSLRFPMDERAVAHVVDRIFSEEPVSYHWLREFYRVYDPRFLEEHVRVRVKMVLEEIQREKARGAQGSRKG